MSGYGNLAVADDRCEMRDDVHYRARGFGPDARQHNLLVVNVSPHGLMARCDHEFDVGARVRVVLPLLGARVAEVRWALGGRIGCQFELPVERADYHEMVAGMVAKRG